MDHRAGSNMDAMKGLLGKQLASITDTLAKASQRRDAEVKKRSIAKTSIASAAAPTPPPAPLSIRPSLTSENEGTGSSDSSGIVVFRGNHSKPDQQNFTRFDLGLEQANSIMDNITPRGSPRESSDNGSGDDDPKAMLERLEQIKSTVGTHSENDLVATTSLPVRVDPIADSQERDELMSIWAAISRIPQTNGAQVEDISDDFDPKRMLAELDSTSPSGQGTIGRHVADVVPRELFRDSQGSAPSIEKVVVDSNRSGGAVTVLDETKTPTSCASDSDPRKMLAEIEEMASCANDNNSRTMIAELERMSPSANFSLSDDDDDDLETLRGKLTNLLSASADQDLPVTANQHVQSSNNHDGSAPICNKAEVWAKAEEELNKLIEYTLREEKEYQRTETHRRLLRRLVLSNIAAGADAEDIKDFFNHHRAVIQDVKILPGRDPIKRTQVAHVDFLKRETAILASFSIGSIFGLVPHMELAVPRDGD